MEEQLDWLVIGCFGRPHGIKGFITIHSLTDPKDNILRYPNWHAYIKQHWQPLEIAEVEITHKHMLAKIKPYQSPEEVACLTNVNIAILKSALPSLPVGEYYWHQLIKMQVVTIDGEILGTVQEILSTGANDVLIVQGDKKHLIPYVPGDVIIDIDIATHTIKIDWDVDF